MSYGFRRPEELRGKDGIWGKRFGILAKEFSLIAIGNVLSKQMYLLSRRGLRVAPYSDTFFAAFMAIRTTKTLLFLVTSGSTYCIHFLTKTPIDVLAGGRYAFGNKKLPDIYQRR